MAPLTPDMRRVVREQRLGFCATVCPDGTPNLSPKGSTNVWDDDHLFFADICSPQTVANIAGGSWVELNVVDVFLRTGYRFKGPAVVLAPGDPGFEDGLERLRAAGSKLLHRVKAIVVLEVREARPVVSPVYDDGTVSETETYWRQRARYAQLHEPRDGRCYRPA